MRPLDWFRATPQVPAPIRQDPVLAMPVQPKNDSNFGSLENPNIPISPGQLALLLSGGPTAAGIPVSEKSSMRSTAVFACVSLVSGLIAGLPLEIHEETDKGWRLANEHPLYPLLHDTSNADIGLTSFIWRELMGVHLQLNGNHYSAIERNGGGDIIGFVPMSPWQTEVRGRKEGVGFARSYRYTAADGNVYELPQEDVIHVPGLGFDGMKGISPIQLAARQTIGASLAMENAAARFLANGARTSGIVTQAAGRGLSPEALRELKAEFRPLYQGSENAGEVVFLDNGMDFKTVQMTLRDAELLESRKFSVVDIARIFGVPPFLIGETADMTAWGAGLEQIMLAFLMLNLNRWLERIEAELKLKLFSGTRYYARYDRDALQATNAAGRADFFQKMFGAGMAMNEIRRCMRLTSITGGDEPMVPVNYQPLSKALSANPVQPAQGAKQ